MWHDPDPLNDKDPRLPAWLVPWVYPIGLALVGVGLVGLLVLGYLR